MTKRNKADEPANAPLRSNSGMGGYITSRRPFKPQSFDDPEMEALRRTAEDYLIQQDIQNGRIPQPRGTPIHGEILFLIQEKQRLRSERLAREKAEEDAKKDLLIKFPRLLAAQRGDTSISSRNPSVAGNSKRSGPGFDIWSPNVDPPTKSEELNNKNSWTAKVQSEASQRTHHRYDPVVGHLSATIRGPVPEAKSQKSSAYGAANPYAGRAEKEAAEGSESRRGSASTKTTSYGGTIKPFTSAADYSWEIESDSSQFSEEEQSVCGSAEEFLASWDSPFTAPQQEETQKNTGPSQWDSGSERSNTKRSKGRVHRPPMPTTCDGLGPDRCRECVRCIVTTLTALKVKHTASEDGDQRAKPASGPPTEAQKQSKKRKAKRRSERKAARKAANKAKLEAERQQEDELWNSDSVTDEDTRKEVVENEVMGSNAEKPSAPQDQSHENRETEGSEDPWANCGHGWDATANSDWGNCLPAGDAWGMAGATVAQSVNEGPVWNSECPAAESTKEGSTESQVGHTVPIEVTYWVQLDSANDKCYIPIDSKHVAGPEKNAIDGNLKKVWKWMQDKGLCDKIYLHDAYDLALSMSSDQTPGTKDGDGTQEPESVTAQEPANVATQETKINVTQNTNNDNVQDTNNEAIANVADQTFEEWMHSLGHSQDKDLPIHSTHRGASKKEQRERFLENFDEAFVELSKTDSVKAYEAEIAEKLTVNKDTNCDKLARLVPEDSHANCASKRPRKDFRKFLKKDTRKMLNEIFGSCTEPTKNGLSLEGHDALDNARSFLLNATSRVDKGFTGSERALRKKRFSKKRSFKNCACDDYDYDMDYDYYCDHYCEFTGGGGFYDDSIESTSAYDDYFDYDFEDCSLN